MVGGKGEGGRVGEERVRKGGVGKGVGRGVMEGK